MAVARDVTKYYREPMYQQLRRGRSALGISWVVQPQMKVAIMPEVVSTCKLRPWLAHGKQVTPVDGRQVGSRCLWRPRPTSHLS